MTTLVVESTVWSSKIPYPNEKSHRREFCYTLNAKSILFETFSLFFLEGNENAQGTKLGSDRLNAVSTHSNLVCRHFQMQSLIECDTI